MGRKYTSDVMNYLSIYSRQKLKIFKVVALIHVKEELELVFGFIEIKRCVMVTRLKLYMK